MNVKNINGRHSGLLSQAFRTTHFQMTRAYLQQCTPMLRVLEPFYGR